MNYDGRILPYFAVLRKRELEGRRSGDKEFRTVVVEDGFYGIIIASMDGATYRKIFDELKSDIQSGKYGPGRRLPSVGMLVKRFGSSRATIHHAIEKLAALGRIQKYPKIHVGTGEEFSGSGTESTPCLRTQHRWERTPIGPRATRMGTGLS